MLRSLPAPKAPAKSLSLITPKIALKREKTARIQADKVKFLLEKLKILKGLAKRIFVTLILYLNI